tara:strand:- start:355 stop:603 length:249 start_codon:yes stop_codon:yes gene_type:complete
MVKCKISCRTFGNFETELDLDYYNSTEEICEQVKRTLITTLEMHHFTYLIEQAKKIHFHIHDLEFGQILLLGDDATIWICNH